MPRSRTVMFFMFSSPWDWSYSITRRHEIGGVSICHTEDGEMNLYSLAATGQISLVMSTGITCRTIPLEAEIRSMVGFPMRASKTAFQIYKTPLPSPWQVLKFSFIVSYSPVSGISLKHTNFYSVQNFTSLHFAS